MKQLYLVLFTLVSLIIPQLTFASVPAGDSGASDTAVPVMDWRVTGPSGGDVRALVVDPSDQNRFYFGTLDGQIYTSTDGGQNWRLFYNFNRPQLFIDNIIVDPRDSNTIYVATHRHKEPGGFYKTTDGGRTFRLAQELKGEALHSLTQSDLDPNVLVTGSNTGIFRSTDSGDSWTRLNTTNVAGLQNVESLAIDPRNSSTIYAGTWYLPYKSVDAGRTWSSIRTGMIDDSDVFAIDIDPRNPDHIIASACSGIYDSQNAGNNWRKIQGIPSQSRRTRAIMQHPSAAGLVFAGTTEGFWRSSNGGADGSWTLTTSKQLEINSIAVHPKNPMKVLIGTNNYGVMVSNDGGKTFLPTNGGYSGRFANTILSDRERAGRVYATTINTATGGGFFFVSNDSGETWQPSMRNMPNRLIGYSIFQDERDPNIIYLGTNFGLYHSLDRGASWAPVVAPKPVKTVRTTRRGRASRAAAVSAPTKGTDTGKKAQALLNSLGYKVGTPDGSIGPRTVAAIRGFQADKGLPLTGSLDSATLIALGLGSGSQSTSIGRTVGPDGKVSDGVFLTDVVNEIVPTHDEKDGRPGMLAATNSGLYRTYDPQHGWDRVAITRTTDQKITTVSASVQNPNTIWIGTTNSGVLVSRDAGATWESVSGVPSDMSISVIKQDPQDGRKVYVATKQSFYLTYNDGEKWSRRGGNLPYGDFASIVINPRNTREIYVGNVLESVGGVFRSGDAGQTWSRVDPRDRNLPSQRIWALEFDASDPTRLFVGSHSAGIYIAGRESTASAVGGN